MNGAVRFKLFVMMLLQFAIWGAWLPLVFGYLDHLEFSASEQTWILWAFPISAIVAMFFGNQFADRNFAAERFLAVSHLIGGAALVGLGLTKSYAPFLVLMWVHCLVYVPTISITNSIAFRAMTDPKAEFGPIRMGGTIGWILVAWPLFFLLSDAASRNMIFYVAASASFILAAFSLTLPHTPPSKGTASDEPLAFLKAVKCLAIPAVLVLWFVTLIDATVHDLYFNWTGDFLQKTVGFSQKWVMPIMSIGQIAEIGTMAVLAFFLKRLGWKLTMMIGVLGHAARFATYSYLYQYPGLIVAVQILHGICYAFFFAAVYIYVDEHLPRDIRASTQGLFNLVILGVGPLVARWMGPQLRNHYVLPEAGSDGKSVPDFAYLFQIPMVMALIAAAILAVAFWPPRMKSTDSGPGNDE